MRAAASSAGVNLAGGSFTSALQASVFNQYNDQGLILQNEKGQQAARQASARSAMAGIQVPSALSAALEIGAAGYQGYQRGKELEQAGSKRGSSK